MTKNKKMSNEEEEKAKEATYDDDLIPMHYLLDVLKNPYNKQPEITAYQNLPEPNKQVYKTFCGT